jgi:hypothetical protein
LPEDVALLAKTIGNHGEDPRQNAEIVASLDKRFFNPPEVKAAIDQCRDDAKTPEQKTGLKKDSTPSNAVVESSSKNDDALSAESTLQKSPPAPTPPSPTPVGSGMMAARTGDSGSSGGGTRASNLDGYNAFQKSPEIAGKGYTQAQKSELYQAHKAVTAAPAASTAPAVTVAPAPAPVTTPVPSVRAPAASASAPSSSGRSGYGSAYSGSSGGYGGSSGGSGGGSSYGGSSYGGSSGGGGGGSSGGGGGGGLAWAGTRSRARLAAKATPGEKYRACTMRRSDTPAQVKLLPGCGRAPSGGTYR